MEDIRSVLSQFHSKKKRSTKGDDVQKSSTGPHAKASTSEIPDVFFDEILQKYKLNRSEITLLMFLYRQVYSKPNLYRPHGIGPLNSYAELCSVLHLTHEELGHHLRALENYGFIETVRSGQYFVRKYFTEEFDTQFGQDYDQFF
jgi:DNA-binding MarR family transcriptional regulator